jgi:hypothetical protein
MGKAIDLAALREPFAASDIEWRVERAGQSNGKTWALVLAYVTNRAIMDRLDEVCGPENWRNEFATAPDSGVLCGISIRCGDEWVTKYDGAQNTQVEAVKGGLSGAMKRAGVQWGIGRYLYNLSDGFADVCDDGEFRGVAKGSGDKKIYFKWNPPGLPDWALPGGSGKPSADGRAKPKPKAPPKPKASPKPKPSSEPATPPQVPSDGSAKWLGRDGRHHMFTGLERLYVSDKATLFGLPGASKNKDEDEDKKEWVPAFALTDETPEKGECGPFGVLETVVDGGDNHPPKALLVALVQAGTTGQPQEPRDEFVEEELADDDIPF